MLRLDPEYLRKVKKAAAVNVAAGDWVVTPDTVDDAPTEADDKLRADDE